MHTYQSKDHADLIMEALGSLGSHMSHLHRKFGVTQFVQDPEVLGGIPEMRSFHVDQLGEERSILQTCGQVELVVLDQGRV